jgi:hypothetical protein
LSPLVERYPENLPLREALGIAYLKNHMFDLSRREFNYILKMTRITRTSRCEFPK